jgi:hypothetical protein
VVTNTQLFSDAALKLRNTDPRVFEHFVNLFSVYTEEVTVAVTEADPTTILVMQGRAQQCRALLRLLQECDRVKPTKPTPPSL